MARCELKKRKGRRGGKRSDWWVINGIIIRSAAILPGSQGREGESAPSPSLVMSLSLTILSLLPAAVSEFRGFAGAPPKSNSAKASMLHSWQPALHRPDVIAILRPWNWSVLAPWQLRNPLALWLCVRVSKNNMFFWLPKQTAFPCNTRVVLFDGSLGSSSGPVTQLYARWA